MHAIRIRRLRERGSSTTGTLAILASISVLGVASFSQLGGGFGESIEGKSEATAASIASSNYDLSPDATDGRPGIVLGSAAHAAELDRELANRMIDYLAGGSMPSEIPAGSDAAQLLQRVRRAVNDLAGNNKPFKDALVTFLKNNPQDLKKILFEGVRDINDISPDLLGIVATYVPVSEFGELIQTLETLAVELETNYGAGRSELQDVLSGKSIEPEANEPDAEEPQADEPDAEEPQADEPDAEEPQADEPEVTEPDTSGTGSASQGGSLVTGDLSPEEAGKALIAAINSSPEAQQAATELQGDDDFKNLLAGAISGDVDAETIINLLRKDAAIDLLQAIADDETTVNMLLGPYASIVAENPTLVRKIGAFAKSASSSERALLVDLIEDIRNGDLDAQSALKYLPLLGNENAADLIADLADSESVATLARQYLGSYADILTSNPELAHQVSSFVRNASPEEMALISDIVTNGFNDQALTLLLNPDVYDIFKTVWNSDAGREAIISQLPGPVAFLAGIPFIGNAVPGIARFWAMKTKYGFWKAVGLSIDGWLDRTSGQECSGWSLGCRAKQGVGLVAAGVKKVGGWVSGLFGGGDDEPAKAVGSPAAKPETSTPSEANAPASSTPSENQGNIEDAQIVDPGTAADVVATNLPPVLGYTPAYGGLLERQMMRIAAERAMQAETP